METSPLLVKCWKFWPMLVNYGHCTERFSSVPHLMRVIRHGTSVSTVIENPWHSHPMPSVWHRIFSVGGKLLQNQLGRVYLFLFKLLWNFSMLGKLNHGLFRPIVFHMLYVNNLRIFSISGFILRLDLCIFCAKIVIKEMTFPLITKSKIKPVSKKKNLKGIENDQMCPILVLHGTNYIDRYQKYV